MIKLEVNEKIFFGITFMITRSFVPHLCAYHIIETGSRTFLNIENLHHFMPLDLYVIQKNLYIAPKYDLSAHL
jgi:hypothetical protein